LVLIAGDLVNSQQITKKTRAERHTMALTKKQKNDIIKKFQLFDGDTGSPEVQIALLTASIQQLTAHLKQHKKDDHSRRGLLKQVAKRRRLLNFLKGRSQDRYDKLIKLVGLK
jgi:small subunit ribosomal protein S15